MSAPEGQPRIESANSGNIDWLPRAVSRATTVRGVVCRVVSPVCIVAYDDHILARPVTEAAEQISKTGLFPVFTCAETYKISEKLPAQQPRLHLGLKTELPKMFENSDELAQDEMLPFRLGKYWVRTGTIILPSIVNLPRCSSEYEPLAGSNLEWQTAAQVNLAIQSLPTPEQVDGNSNAFDQIMTAELLMNARLEFTGSKG